METQLVKNIDFHGDSYFLVQSSKIGISRQSFFPDGGVKGGNSCIGRE